MLLGSYRRWLKEINVAVNSLVNIALSIHMHLQHTHTHITHITHTSAPSGGSDAIGSVHRATAL